MCKTLAFVKKKKNTKVTRLRFYMSLETEAVKASIVSIITVLFNTHKTLFVNYSV